MHNKWSTSVKDFCAFIDIDLRSAQLHILSCRCSLHRSIEGGDNDKMHRNIRQQRCRDKRQDATTSVATVSKSCFPCHQQHWHNKKFTLIEEQFVDDIDDIDNKFSTTFSATSSSTRAVSTRRVINKLIKTSSFSATSPTSSLTLSSTSSSSRKSSFSRQNSSEQIQQEVHQQQGSSTKFIDNKFYKERFIDNKFYIEFIGDNSFQEVWGNPWCATTSVWSSNCP